MKTSVEISIAYSKSVKKKCLQTNWQSMEEKKKENLPKRKSFSIIAWKVFPLQLLF